MYYWTISLLFLSATGLSPLYGATALGVKQGLATCALGGATAEAFVEGTTYTYLDEAVRLKLRTGMEVEFDGPSDMDVARVLNYTLDIKDMGTLSHDTLGTISFSSDFTHKEVRVGPMAHAAKADFVKFLQALKESGAKGTTEKRDVSIQFNVDVNDPVVLRSLLLLWYKNRSHMISQFPPNKSRSRWYGPLKPEIMAKLEYNKKPTKEQMRDILNTQNNWQNSKSIDLNPYPLVDYWFPRAYTIGALPRPAVEFRIFDIDFENIPRVVEEWEFCLSMVARAMDESN